VVEITAQIIDDFRAYYPEFVEPGTTGAKATFSDVLLTRLLCEADEETGPRWGAYDAGACSLKKRGMFAYTAHKAVLAKAAERAVSAGGSPQAIAQVQSKTVGDESVTFAVAAPTAREMAQLGDLATTMYGQEFVRLRKRAGMGAAII
jgi:hypothetical protein